MDLAIADLARVSWSYIIRLDLGARGDWVSNDDYLPPKSSNNMMFI